jgi:RND family efflux transporter MFP subunit
LNDSRRNRPFIRILPPLGGATLLVLLMLYMTGMFTPNRVGPETRVPAAPEVEEPAQTARARLETVTEVDRAVGTVRPQTQTRVESQVTARILEVKVRPGDDVDRGDVLIVLDGSQLRSKVDQARQAVLSAQARRRQAAQAVRSAEAVFTEAEAAYERTRTYFQGEAATEQDMERARSAFLQAKAGVERAQQSLQEAEAGVRQAEKVVEESRIALGYTRIEAQESGQVAERTAEPGDMAWPGKALLLLQTRGALRLESLVREGLIHRIRVGSRMTVSVDVLDRELDGVVDEVVPFADPVTRTFLVKVSLPQAEGLYPGMFGRLLVPVADHEIVTVPRKAVVRVGQLEMVTVRAGGRWERVFVKTGRVMEGRVEVLAGLDGGETLALDGGAR